MYSLAMQPLVYNEFIHAMTTGYNYQSKLAQNINLLINVQH